MLVLCLIIYDIFLEDTNPEIVLFDGEGEDMCLLLISSALLLFEDVIIYY